MTPAVTRWRLALTIARRTALRAKARTVLTVALIALPVAAITFLTGAYASSQPTVASQISWNLGSAAQARLTAPVAETFQSVEQDPFAERTEFLPGKGPARTTTARAADLVPASDRLVEARHQSGLISFGDRLVRDVGFHLVDTALVPGLLGPVSGNPTPDAHQVVLRGTIAKRLGAQVGDQVTIITQNARATVQVVGIGDSASPYAGILGAGALPDSATIPQWWVVGDTPVTWQNVEAFNALGFRVHSRAVMESPPPAAAVYGGRFARPDATATGEMEGLAYAAIALGLIEVVLLVGPAFAVGAKRSARSMALIAATGGRHRDLGRIMLAHGLIAGLLAAAAGVSTGVVAAIAWYVIASREVAGPVNLVIPAGWPLAAAALAVLLGGVAAYLPARAAARTEVVAALAGRPTAPPRGHKTAYLGGAVALIGALTALGAALAAEPLLLVGGVTLTVIGTLFATSVLVDAAARLAPHLRFAGRFALRDAARHRGRTVPAVAAVMATMTVAVAGLIGVATDAAVRNATWAPIAATGTGVIAPQLGADRADLAPDFDAITAAVHAVAPTAIVTPVKHLVATSETRPWSTWVETDPVTVATAAAACESDPEQCTSQDGRAQDGFSFERGLAPKGLAVDDGTMTARLGLPGAAQAAQVLSAGTILVHYRADLWPDGNARILVLDADRNQIGEAVALPAEVIPWVSSSYVAVLPPTVADRLMERSGGQLTVLTDGALVTGADLNPDVTDRVNARLAVIDIELRLDVEGRLLGQQPDPRFATAITVAALITALAAVMVAIALAGADLRADLATLAAVGGPRRIRQRIGAAQGAVIAVIGTAAGLVAGVPVGYLFAAWRAANSAEAVGWQFVLPWLPVLSLTMAVPGIGITIGALTARVRLPLRSRASQF